VLGAPLMIAPDQSIGTGIGLRAWLSTTNYRARRQCRQRVWHSAQAGYRLRAWRTPRGGRSTSDKGVLRFRSSPGSFVIPEGMRAHFAAKIGPRGAELRKAWSAAFARSVTAGTPADLWLEHDRHVDGDASSKILNAVAERVPWSVMGPRLARGSTAHNAARPEARLCWHLGDLHIGGSELAIVFATGSVRSQI
jgi:hypothetical protein